MYSTRLRLGFLALISASLVCAQPPTPPPVVHSFGSTVVDLTGEESNRAKVEERMKAPDAYFRRHTAFDGGVEMDSAAVQRIVHGVLAKAGARVAKCSRETRMLKDEKGKDLGSRYEEFDALVYVMREGGRKFGLFVEPMDEDAKSFLGYGRDGEIFQSFLSTRYEAFKKKVAEGKPAMFEKIFDLEEAKISPAGEAKSKLTIGEGILVGSQTVDFAQNRKGEVLVKVEDHGVGGIQAVTFCEIGRAGTSEMLPQDMYYLGNSLQYELKGEDGVITGSPAEDNKLVLLPHGDRGIVVEGKLAGVPIKVGFMQTGPNKVEAASLDKQAPLHMVLTDNEGKLKIEGTFGPKKAPFSAEQTYLGDDLTFKGLPKEDAETSFTDHGEQKKILGLAVLKSAAVFVELAKLKKESDPTIRVGDKIITPHDKVGEVKEINGDLVTVYVDYNNHHFSSKQLGKQLQFVDGLAPDRAVLTPWGYQAKVKHVYSNGKAMLSPLNAHNNEYSSWDFELYPYEIKKLSKAVESKDGFKRGQSAQTSYGYDVVLKEIYDDGRVWVHYVESETSKVIKLKDLSKGTAQPSKARAWGGGDRPLRWTDFR